MPPKKPAPPAGNKKTQEKKKEKIIEVRKEFIRTISQAEAQQPC